MTDLDKGEPYELVIVAVSGHGDNRRETESPPEEFTPGGPIEGNETGIWCHLKS